MHVNDLIKAREKADEMLWDAISQIGYDMACDLRDELRRKSGDHRLHILSVHDLGRKFAEAIANEYKLPS